MQNLNKKGLTQVVSILIVTLFSISAVSLLAYSVFVLSDGVSNSPAISCLQMQANFPVSIENVCYSKDTREVEVILRRNLDDRLSINKLNFVVSGNKAEQWMCGDGCSCNVVSPGGEKKYYFSVSDFDSADEFSMIYYGCVVETRNIRDC